MVRPRPLIVLGAGPVGLLAAIRGRQLRLDVEIHSNDVTLAQSPRVECVPSQVIALLVEFGVSPKALGVEALFTERILQWSDRTPIAAPTPAAAHVGRPALEEALREVALCSGATIHRMQDGRLDEFEQRHRAGDCLLLDASGRAAITAIERATPRQPIVARLLQIPMRPDLHRPGLMIAAGPEGYAYRLGNATTLTLAVVGRGDFVRGRGRQIVATVKDFAPWLVDGIRGEDLQPGASGPASMQWSLEDGSSISIGDANFARDALASQGLAIGFSDALKAVATAHQRPSLDSERHAAIELHRRRVSEQIGTSAFKSSPAWVDYARFLADMTAPATRSDVSPAAHAS